MLASEPGETLGQLTVEGVPRIIRIATAVPRPARRAVPRPAAASRALIDVLARLDISYFLAPSDAVDLGDETSARAFLARSSPPSIADPPLTPIQGASP